MWLTGLWRKRTARAQEMRAESPPRMYRQGDVLVMSVTALPAGARPVTRRGRIVLAYGEVTGHAHAIEDVTVEQFVRDGTTFLRIREAPATLRHEEHAPIELPPGDYEVRRQREYAPLDAFEREMAEERRRTMLQLGTRFVSD